MQSKDLLYTKSEFDSILKKNIEQYNPPNIIQSVRESLKPKKERQCIFCGKSMPSTTFNTKAHFLSKCIGNQLLLTDKECDNCNNIFSIYENDLTEFIGAIKPIFYNKNSKPKNYISHSSNYKIQPFQLQNDYALLITGGNFSENNYLIKSEFSTNPFIPLNIYKVLVKYALLSIDDVDLVQYSILIKKLFNSNYIPLSNNILLQKFDNIYLEHPLLMVHKRIDTMKDIPLHFFSLYFYNCILHYTIPSDDYTLLKHINFPPPLFLDENLRKINSIKSSNIDLSSIDKIRMKQIMEIKIR